MKVVDIQIQGNRCYYRFNGCSNEELMLIREFKSWEFRSWEYGIERKYFLFVYKNTETEKILWSYIGFSPILIRYLQSIGYLINGKELFRAKSIDVGHMKYRLYDYQQDATNAWINSGSCGVIKICTSGGKTICACDIISRMKTRTIILVHTSDLLLNTWFNVLVEQFGESIKLKIGIIGGSLSKKDRQHMGIDFNTSYESNISKDIVVATAQSLLNKLDKLYNERFGLLIWDEVHHVSADQFNKVASAIKSPFRLGLTATIVRPDGTTPLIYGMMGDIVYRITIRELVKKKVLVEPTFNEIIINDMSIQNEISSCGLTKLELSRFVKQKSASSVIKMNYILKLAKSLSLNNKKFIMYADFVNSKNKEIFVRDFYVKELNNLGVKVVGVSSDMNGMERQKVFALLESGKIDGLIFGKLGAEGLNLPLIDSVIMNNSSKSTILFPQRTGRSMRLSKSDVAKKNAFIYEIILNTPMERSWSSKNFFEYEIENYSKNRIFVE